MTSLTLILSLVALVAGAVVGWVLAQRRAQRVSSAEKAKAADAATRIVEDAQRQAQDIEREARLRAKEAALATLDKEKAAEEKLRSAQEAERHQRMREDALRSRQTDIERREQLLGKREADVQTGEAALGEKRAAIDKAHEEARANLERVAGLTQDQARKDVIKSITDEAKLDAAKRVKVIEEETREQSQRTAKHIISTAIMRFAGEYVSERTVSVVNLPSDDMKGRIIGREGRNIRAFEAVTGIDLIIDDTPEAVILSGFNPVRREVARIALERLISDGRIHPSRIEEVVEKTRQEVDESMKEAGEFAVLELGLGGVRPELVKVIGRLKYRTSYTQNVLMHSIEVGFLAGTMMAELGLDSRLGRRAGLLHDIGKAIDHEVEGPHALIGSQLLRKFGEPKEIIHAVAAHHGEEKPNSVLACIVAAADALSGARPGARREMLETYIKRLEELEAISQSFAGVEKSFAIQAGREVRIMVENSEVNDAQALMLAKDIAKQIEEKLTYPGQIKVTVIRETRAVEYAR